MNLKELENLSLSTNTTLNESVDVTRLDASTDLVAVDPAKEADGTSAPKETSTSKNGEDALDFLAEMMTTQFHHPHHRGAFHQVGSIIPFPKAITLQLVLHCCKNMKLYFKKMLHFSRLVYNVCF